MLVHLDRDDVHAPGPSGRQHDRVRKDIDQQAGLLADVGARLLAPRVGEQLKRLGEAIRRAAGHDDLRSALVGDVGVEDLAGELADEGEEGRVALGGAVLEGAVQVDLLQGVALG